MEEVQETLTNLSLINIIWTISLLITTEYIISKYVEMRIHEKTKKEENNNL